MKYWHKRVDVVSYHELPDNLQQDIDEDSVYLLSDDEEECWDLGHFMRVADSRYHGVMSLTNTSAIGVVFSNNCEEAVIQCFG